MYLFLKKNSQNPPTLRVTWLSLCARDSDACLQNRFVRTSDAPRLKQRNSSSKQGFARPDGWNCAGVITTAGLTGRVSALCWMELTFSNFFSDRSDVDLQAADVGDGGPAGEGAPRHEKERIRGWEVEWLWGQSSIWRIYWRCCKEVDYF